MDQELKTPDGLDVLQHFIAATAQAEGVRISQEFGFSSCGIRRVKVTLGDHSNLEKFSEFEGKIKKIVANTIYREDLKDKAAFSINLNKFEHDGSGSIVGHQADDVLVPTVSAIQKLEAGL